MKDPPPHKKQHKKQQFELSLSWKVRKKWSQSLVSAVRRVWYWLVHRYMVGPSINEHSKSGTPAVRRNLTFGWKTWMKKSTTDKHNHENNKCQQQTNIITRITNVNIQLPIHRKTCHPEIYFLVIYCNYSIYVKMAMLLLKQPF